MTTPSDDLDAAARAMKNRATDPEGGASKLIAGLTEAVDIAQGRAEPARVRTIAVTQDAPKTPTQGDSNDH